MVTLVIQPIELQIQDIWIDFLQVYDVSSFVWKHPGGVDQILCGAGRDITQVFESYHNTEVAKWVSQP